MSSLVRTVAIFIAGILAACSSGNDASDRADATEGAAGSAAASAAASVSEFAQAAPSEPADGAPEGFERIVVADAGFSLALPDGWETISAEELSETGVMDELMEANPDAQGPLEQARAALENDQIALFAFDAREESISSGFAANVNAIDVGPVEGTAEDAGEEIVAAIEDQVPVNGEVSSETVTLPAGEAALIRYEWSVANASGETVDVSVTQYAILAEGGGFVLSMSAATDTLDQYEETFRQIAESFSEE